MTPFIKIIRQKLWRYHFWKRLGLALGGLFFLSILLNIFFPLQVNIQYAPLVEARDGTVLHAFLNPQDKWRMMIEIEEITDELREAFLQKEDRYFYWHMGFNPLAMVRAFFNNTLQGRRTSGASTITMQVARLLNPKPRTYGNKIIEVFRACQLEWYYSKDEILQMYLNLVPYGGNIEGVKAAAMIYFEKAPDHLSLAEITALTVIPNRPNSLTLGKHNDRITTERNYWLQHFLDKDVFPTSALEDALDEPLVATRNQVPRQAPHFSYRVKEAQGYKPITKTTLNWNLQQNVSALVRNHVGRLYQNNIKNAAVLVLDNATGDVLAYVGSADFNNSEDAGQVDGVRAVRSPGSTLKPLLYALAFDQGFATPKSIVSDVPVSYSGYEPTNFDEKFHGNISVEFALANSLNIPAVKMLDRLGVSEFVGALKQADFNQIRRDAGHLGLSTVLGGCGVRLEELAGLYRAFANSGSYQPPVYYQGRSNRDSITITSTGSSFLITEILTQVTRPDLPLQWHNAQNLPKVAWKTGTSYGRRDAWSVGYNQHYTVAVWVGNFSGEGVPDLTGAQVAAPLFFQVFNAVDYNTPKEWYAIPNTVGFRYVCSETGSLPNHYCQDQVMDYYLPSITSTKKCNHLRSIWVNPEATYAYCTTCLPHSGYQKKWYPNYSASVVSYMQTNNIPFETIPQHNPECERVWVAGAPDITSPLHGTEYFVNESDSMQMMLSVQVQNDVKEVYWYINDRFYRKAQQQQNIFFEPNPGKVKISCSDDKGRNTDIVINVKQVGF